MKYSIKGFFTKCNLQETANLVTCTKEIVNGTSFFVQRVMSSLSSIVQLAEVYSEHCQTFQMEHFCF